MSHEAHDGEDDEAGKHTGARVDAANDDGVPKSRRPSEVTRDDYRRVGLEGSNLQGNG